MRKIPALFVREERGNPKDQTGYLPVINKACLWVFNPGVRATRKWDGTAVLVQDGMPWARFDAKRGKTPPVGFVPAQDPDPITGHHPGWVPATRPEDKWIREAFEALRVSSPLREVPDGTYEAVGPKINSNKEGLDSHQLIRHGVEELPLELLPGHDEAVFEWVRAALSAWDVEGVVFWGPDGQMCKCTKSGLKLPRKPLVESPGEQTAVRKPDGSHEIDRQDGLGPVPTQPYCADCDSPCEFGECDPPHLCRKHAACARCNP